MLARLVPPNAAVKPGWRAMRLALTAAFAGIAIAGPRWGVDRTIVPAEGVDIVLAVDASLSMMATDERPNRLEKVKQEIRRLRASSPSDRFALLAFAGRSYILTPLTVDDGALDLFLDNLDPSVLGQAGSSLARAIRQGTDLLVANQGWQRQGHRDLQRRRSVRTSRGRCCSSEACGRSRAQHRHGWVRGACRHHDPRARRERGDGKFAIPIVKVVIIISRYLIERPPGP